MQPQSPLLDLYAAYNIRDIDAILASVAEDVDWPNGWEGGRVIGRAAMRRYWKRQWSAIDPIVEPTAILERPDGSIEVTVRQVVRALDGEVLSDRIIRHVFSLSDDLV
ncbi:MAG: nuclear transport factor 2 family protein, partial [Gemmataceae bacterium]